MIHSTHVIPQQEVISHHHVIPGSDPGSMCGLRRPHGPMDDSVGHSGYSRLGSKTPKLVFVAARGDGSRIREEEASDTLIPQLLHRPAHNQLTLHQTPVKVDESVDQVNLVG